MAVETYPLVRQRFSFLRALKRVNYWHWTLLIVVSTLVVTPLALLTLGSFSTAALPTDISISKLSFENYIDVWTDPATYALFYNTGVYVTGATTLGITLAAVLAWMVERTNIPGKIWIYAGVPLTLVLPGLLQAMAWVLLLSPRIGFINKFLIDTLGLGTWDDAINIYSLGGMIFVEGFRLVPTAFLMMVPLLRSMDPALEEAAAMSGARPSSTLRKVTFGLMLPGLLAVLIYQFITAFEVFEVPGILGMPADIFVFSTKIYALHRSVTVEPAYGEANALSMIYLLVAVVATYLYSRVIAKSEKFTIITGKGYRPRVMDLGAWKWPAFSLVFIFLLVTIILPFLVFLYVSFLPYLMTPSLEAFQAMTFEFYIEVFNDELIGISVWNTFLMTVVTSTAVVVVSFLISLVVVRSKFWGRRLLDQMSFMPHAIPGIVMGVAFLWVFINIDNLGIPIYGGIWSITIAFTVGYIAYGTRAMNAAILQIHKDLEEAAYVSGAVQWRTMWRVFYPLMIPTFVGVWIWVMLHAVRAASLPLILTEGPENQVLAVLVWNMWDEGAGGIQMVGVIGVIMIVLLMGVTMCFRAFGFGSSRHIQGT
ncbi:MAG: iron ABC transporter permease [Alphaproteobacteria bacterium]|nr:iron ABC transporter permease [Alphaproteobacteria bacterium]